MMNLLSSDGSTDPGLSPVPGSGKKKKRLNAITKQSGRWRLVEYFIVVSSVPRKNGEGGDDESTSIVSASSPPSSPPATPSRIAGGGSRRDDRSVLSSSVLTTDTTEEEEFVDDFDFQPVITARYPLEDHEDNPLHESVTCFCHPSGGIRLRFEFSMPKIHYFVSTGGNGKQMYGTCLTLWEPYIITLTKSKKKKKNAPQDVRYRNGGNSDEEEPVQKKKEVFLPKCVVLLSMHPYLVAFREFLTQLNRLSKMGDMPLPIERYITNFCSEIPAPPPGSFEVQTTILDSVIKFWSPPYNQPIAWVALPFSHLFECLDLDNVLTVWHALALERQVLLTSTQLSLLTTCSEILLSLLFPMRWSHAYIPVLPHFLIPILSAPMPYLCGITKGNLVDALCDLSRECVVVDLDKNLVTLGPGTAPLPPLPQGHMASLRRKLEDNVGMIFREARSLTKSDDFSDRGMHLPPHIKMMADAMWESRLCLFDEAFHMAFTPEEARKNLLNGNDSSGIETTSQDLHNPTVPIRIMTAAEKQNLRKQSQWDAVQEAFLDTYVFMLRNYRRFLVFPSKENEGSYGGAGFRSKEFIQSQRYDMQAFLEQLVGTQMFDDFVTKRLYGSGEADVTFFDMAVDRFLKNSGLLSNVDVGGTLLRASGVQRPGSVVHSGRRDQGDRRDQSGTRKASIRNLFSKSQNRANANTASSRQSSSAVNKGPGPLLQSARVHRKLKTIVPPEPSCEDIPAPSLQQSGGVVVTCSDDVALDDDNSVSSTSTSGTHSTKGTLSTARSGATGRSGKAGYGSSYTKRQEKLADMLEKERKYCYMYPTFPSEFNPELFGTPRPLPSAVLAEFDRQKENAGRFRRKKHHDEEEDAKARGKHRKAPTMEKLSPPDKPPSAEVATFTVFFMSFTAVVGKELLDISHNPLLKTDNRTILSTYTHPKTVDESEEETDHDDSQSNRSEAVGRELSCSDRNASASEGGEDGNDDNSESDGDASDSSDKIEKENEVNHELTASKDNGSQAGKIGANGEESLETPKSEDGGLGPGTKDTDGNESDSATNEPEFFDSVSGVDKKNSVPGENDTAEEKSFAESKTVDRNITVEERGERVQGDDGSEGSREEVNTNGSIDERHFDKGEDAPHAGTPTKKNQVDKGSSTPMKTPKFNNRRTDMNGGQPRSRFSDDLSTLQIEEAKATAKAQLGLAFEMLTMMRKRGLKADPEAYQCLVDACGRCGDTERATQLLAKMHEDGIVADGVVYSCLVSAFSSSNTWKKDKNTEELPEWANSASVEMDWNKLQRRSILDSAKERIEAFRGSIEDDNVSDDTDQSPSAFDLPDSSGRSRKPGMGLRQSSVRAIQSIMSRRSNEGHKRIGSRSGAIDPHGQTSVENVRNFFVSEPVMRQILLGENLLEIVYPDISIDTDNEFCPRCNFCLSDDDVVSGWTALDPQDYTTTCPNCTQKFVPRFCVQCTSPTFVGSRGPSSPLLCERLSPWVLQKELRSVMSDREGIENLLNPEWREQETKNAVLWWNLVLSFMRYRFPFSFLLQGSFEQNLIAPTPGDDAS